jgi:hypothetical protein
MIERFWLTSVKGKRCETVDKIAMFRGRKVHGKRGKSCEQDDENDQYDEATLRAIMNTYPDTEIPDTFVYGYVTLRFNPDGSFLTKLNLNGLLPNCLNCGAHAHE